MKKLFLLLICLSLYGLSFAQAPTHPSKAYLGVNYNHIETSKAKELGFDNKYGVYITEVFENTAAEKIGIQPFDYITGINDQPFTAHQRFKHSMQDYKAGDQASLQMIRDGKAMSVPVTFGKQREAIFRKIPKEEEPFLGVKQDHYNWRENVPGVKVQIVTNSTAEKMDLQDDDIITSINDKTIIDWHDLGTAVDNMTPGENIKINFLRDGQAMMAQAPIQSYGQTYESKSHHKKKEIEEVEEAKEVDEVEEVEEIVQTEDEIEAMLKNITNAIEMENVTQEEADDMKKKVGVDMPVINNLEIEKLTIFPNPNDGVFNLMFDLPNQGQTIIRIFNGSGSLIYQNEMQQFSGFFKDRIDISERAKGLYFLEVNQDGKSITKKVILQ